MSQEERASQGRTQKLLGEHLWPHLLSVVPSLGPAVNCHLPHHQQAELSSRDSPGLPFNLGPAPRRFLSSLLFMNGLCFCRQGPQIVPPRSRWNPRGKGSQPCHFCHLHQHRPITKSHGCHPGNGSDLSRPHHQLSSPRHAQVIKSPVWYPIPVTLCRSVPISVQARTQTNLLPAL